MRGPKVANSKHDHFVRVALAVLAVVTALIATGYIAVWRLPLANSG